VFALVDSDAMTAGVGRALKAGDPGKIAVVTVTTPMRDRTLKKTTINTTSGNSAPNAKTNHKRAGLRG
jgi:hypothetical protein